jgi:sugar transferase (PEP-CTERM/EpsH1 system associated)
MRILWLSHMVPYPPKGGMLQRAFHLVRELASRNDVKLLCFNQKAMLPTQEAVQSAVDALRPFVEVVDVVDIPSNTRRFGRELLAAGSYLRGRAYTIEWLRSPQYARAVAKAIQQHSPELVHFDTISLVQFRELAGNRPCVLNHHNIESMMMDRRAEVEKHPLKRHYYATEGARLREYEKKYAGTFDLNLTCSELDAQRLKQIAPAARTEEVPNGVDLDYFRPAPDDNAEEPHSLIFAGGLNWYPNVSAVKFLVNEVWPLVRADFSDATLTIIGRSPPQWLKDCAAADARLRVTGFVDDVRPYMDRASVYVCPIFDGGGTKLKVLDAMAMGKPLVANPIAVEGIDAQPQQHWIPANEPREFAAAIGRLFADASLRRTLGRNARQLIHDKYSFAEIGARLSERYRSLRRD